MAFAQSRGVTPELMAAGAERQHRLLERVGEDITATPELTGLEVQSVQTASRQTLALLIGNIDEVLGAPIIERVTLSPGQVAPSRGVEGKYLNTHKRIRGPRFYTFTFPDDNYLLMNAIAESLHGKWFYRNYTLRNLRAGWHIDNIRLYSTQSPGDDVSGLNFWRSIQGETQANFALPSSRDDIDTLANRFSRRDIRAQVAVGLPASDDLVMTPGQALLFPGSTEVTTGIDVPMAGVAHKFTNLSRPRYSSLISIHFPHTQATGMGMYAGGS